MTIQEWNKRSSRHLSRLFALASALFFAAPALAEQTKDLAALMTRAKLEADLGNYTAAAEAFARVGNDQSAPAPLRWEALVRLGVARGAASDIPGSIEAFKAVAAHYSADPEALRFLTGAMAAAAQGKVWPDFKTEIEGLLRTAEVISVEELAMDVTMPKRVALRWGDFEARAVWKPIPRRLRLGVWESYGGEIAAYELDKMLGLDMVPPAVERTIEGRKGALQLWVNGCRTYKEVTKTRKTEKASDASRQISRMKLFDNLIGNPDRNAANLLVDPSGELVLVDHILCFITDSKLKDLPLQFDGRLVQKLRALDVQELQGHFKGILETEEIQGILKRRDALLAHIDALVAERGAAAVIF